MIICCINLFIYFKLIRKVTLFVYLRVEIFCFFKVNSECKD